MVIRDERAGDHAAVGALVENAFGDATVVRLVDALRRDDPDALSLVAETGDEPGRPVEPGTRREPGTPGAPGAPGTRRAVVGHVMVSRALLDAPERLVPVTTLSPLAVAPSWQRRGVGLALIRESLRRLDERGVPLVFLEGDPGFYIRAGFVPAGELGFRKPSLRIPDPAFQVVRLSAYEPWMTGTFVYSDTFWRLDCVGLR